MRILHFTAKIVLTDMTTFPILYFIKREFLSIASGSEVHSMRLAAESFNYSFSYGVADAMLNDRSDEKQNWHALTNFYLSGYFFKKTIACRYKIKK
ncbi:MAG: hypothetical protein CVU55_14695 [Deltaproteobacteria bacterium HGW-Deltaproteobacteria-13]|jgi:hypothetical protein|nr:MAG: hypothetical protein CVU55_14695 [Deltaproteobacteria bacterium HGW-Deltaproteobacteria-13]